jgi:hypothetical protein
MTAIATAAATTTTTKNWHIEIDEVCGDYTAYVIVDGQQQYIGSARTYDGARAKISAYNYPDPS